MFFEITNLRIRDAKLTPAKSKYINEEEYFFHDEADEDEHEELVSAASFTFAAESFQAL